MVNIFYTFYGQFNMIPIIENQNIKCTIIDDCYPIPLQNVKNCDVYRILDDINWNIPGAKNLGFHVLDGWILACAIDHVITPEIYEKLNNLDKKRGEVYFPQQMYKGKLNESPHDIVLIHKEDYNIIGGYEEDFAGSYGYEDGLFYEMVKNNFKDIELYDIIIDINENGYTQKFDRDSSRNLEIFLKKDKFKMTTQKLRFSWKKNI